MSPTKKLPGKLKKKKLKKYRSDMKRLPKNRDMTRLINFRLRVTDCEKLDKFANTNNMSRTAAIEKLITSAAECQHRWVSVNDVSSVCSHCREWKSNEIKFSGTRQLADV
jgi:hypothetical protein